jgi:hypothetical protein
LDLGHWPHLPASTHVHNIVDHTPIIIIVYKLIPQKLIRSDDSAWFIVSNVAFLHFLTTSSLKWYHSKMPMIAV